MVTIRVSVVDLGIGNLRSVEKAFQRIGVAVEFVSTPRGVLTGSRLVLPGVGHFQEGMRRLERSGLRDALTRRVIDEATPLLGICLGMQLLARFSEEGDLAGLGWINANVVRFDRGQSAPRPMHIGWNTLEVLRPSPLLRGISEHDEFYFVHAFYAASDGTPDVVATARYGATFSAVVQSGGIFGVQFHPEKSHLSGLRIMNNFART